MRALIFAVVVVLIVVAPVDTAAGGTQQTLARVSDPMTLRQWAGFTVVASFDRDRGYVVRLVEPGGRTRRLPIDVSSLHAPAIDIGPGPDGQPTIVYDSYGELWMLAIASRRARPITAANTRDEESSPTIWRDRIAFTRLHDRTAVYVRSLDWPDDRASQRLPGPQPGFDAHSLELHGHTLALVIDTVRQGLWIDEIRLDNIQTHATRVVWELARDGLSDARLSDLSFANGWLGWARACYADPGGCSATRGAVRYRYREGRRWERTQYAAGRYVASPAFALTPHGTLAIIANGDLGEGGHGGWGPASAAAARSCTPAG